MIEDRSDGILDSARFFQRFVTDEKIAEPSGVFLQMLDDAPLGIYLVQEGMIVFGNRWLREFGGYALDDLPIPALSVIAPEDRSMVGEQIVLRLRGDTAARPSYPVRFLSRNGRITWVQLIARTVEWRGQQAIQGSIVDISQRVADEQKLRDYATRLESANRTKALLLEVLSHNILDKLAAAGARIAGLPREGQLTAAHAGDIASAKSCLVRAEALMREATALLRLEDVTDLVLAPLDPKRMMEEVVGELEPLLEDRKVTVDFETDVAELMADQLLREVFSSLIADAIRFAPPGTTVKMSAEGEEAVRIRIADSGPGISEDYRESIFGYQNLPDGTGRGMGISLALISRIVELHHGRVWIEDNPGGGSVFVAELPQRPPGSRKGR